VPDDELGEGHVAVEFVGGLCPCSPPREAGDGQ